MTHQYEIGNFYYVTDEKNNYQAVQVHKTYKNGSLRVTPVSEQTEIGKLLNEQVAGGKPGRFVNSYFYMPQLPPEARFGGYDERMINSYRSSSCPLLKLCYANYIPS